jgi:hypothetical protein
MISAKSRLKNNKRAHRQNDYSQGKPLYLLWGKTWKQVNLKLSPLAKKEN